MGMVCAHQWSNTKRVSAELGIGIQNTMGLVPSGLFWYYWAGWFVGDLLAMVIITPVLVKGLTNLVERQGLINDGWVT